MSEGLDRVDFDASVDSICADLDLELVTPSEQPQTVPDTCSDEIKLLGETSVALMTEYIEFRNLDNCLDFALSSACVEKRQNLADSTSYFTSQNGETELAIADSVSILCETDQDCNESILRSEWLDSDANTTSLPIPS